MVRARPDSEESRSATRCSFAAPANVGLWHSATVGQVAIAVAFGGSGHRAGRLKTTFLTHSDTLVSSIAATQQDARTPFRRAQFPGVIGLRRSPKPGGGYAATRFHYSPWRRRGQLAIRGVRTARR
jgi:hypothetical protein